MRKHDLGSSLIWLGVGLFITLISPGLDLGVPSAPGSGFMPFLTGLMICIFSVVTFLQACLEKGEEKENLWVGVQFRKLLIVVFVLLAYILLLKPVGYLICTFFLVLALTRFTGSEAWRAALLTSLLGSSLSYLLFDTLLRAYLPAGIFG